MVGAEKFLNAGLKANVIFLAPPSVEELKKRLLNRGTEKIEVIKKRLAIARRELEDLKTKDFIKHVFINDDFESFFGKIISHIKQLYPHFAY